MKSVDFTVGSHEFRLTKLGPVDALKGVGQLTRIIESVFADGRPDSETEAQAMLAAALRSAVTELAPFYQLLSPNLQIKRDGAYFELSVLEDEIFGDDPALLVSVTLEAVLLQYRGFLAANGQALLGVTVNRLISLIGSLGQSGE